MNRINAFSLIEVVVSFAIISSLGIVLVQSEMASINVLNKTKKIDIVSGVIQTKLLEIELDPPNSSFQNSSDIFGADAKLVGAKWQLDQTADVILNLPMRRVTYKIKWLENDVEKSLSDFIFIEPSESMLDELKF